MKIYNYKSGNSIIAIPLLLVICVFVIILIGTNIVNSLIPFIYHQKLLTIANKYMFVIEKFGYLTEEEKNLLMQELNACGFDISRVVLKYPSEIKAYGELIEFEIRYDLFMKSPTFANGTYGMKEKETILTVRKNSFSKI